MSESSNDMPDGLPSDAPAGRSSRDQPDTPRARFLRGCGLGLPVLLGYAPVGIAFGILARSTGFSVVEATVCSATALAGAGQFIAISLLGSGANAATVLIATSVVNLRYVLFSTTLAPHVAGASRRALAWLGFSLTDETFAVNIADLRSGLATTGSMAGVGFIAWVGWVTGTAVGASGAEWIGDPTRFGVDFAMPAMFAALFVALSENRRHAAVGTLAAVLALALPALARVGIEIPGGWLVIIASLVSATVASAVMRDE